MRNLPTTAFAIASLTMGLVVPAHAQDTSGQKLTQSELDAVRAQISRCWVLPAGAENRQVKVKFRLDRRGAVQGEPEIIEGGDGSDAGRAAAEAARRAIVNCAPYDSLPPEKYSGWETITLQFDPAF